MSTKKLPTSDQFFGKIREYRTKTEALKEKGVNPFTSLRNLLIKSDVFNTIDYNIHEYYDVMDYKFIYDLINLIDGLKFINNDQLSFLDIYTSKNDTITTNLVKVTASNINNELYSINISILINKDTDSIYIKRTNIDRFEYSIKLNLDNRTIDIDLSAYTDGEGISNVKVNRSKVNVPWVRMYDTMDPFSPFEKRYYIGSHSKFIWEILFTTIIQYCLSEETRYD